MRDDIQDVVIQIDQKGVIAGVTPNLPTPDGAPWTGPSARNIRNCVDLTVCRHPHSEGPGQCLI